MRLLAVVQQLHSSGSVRRTAHCVICTTSTLWNEMDTIRETLCRPNHPGYRFTGFNHKDELVKVRRTAEGIAVFWSDWGKPQVAQHPTDSDDSIPLAQVQLLLSLSSPHSPRFCVQRVSARAHHALLELAGIRSVVVVVVVIGVPWYLHWRAAADR